MCVCYGYAELFLESGEREEGREREGGERDRDREREREKRGREGEREEGERKQKRERSICLYSFVLAFCAHCTCD